jgi:hypothetical protein
MSEVKYPQVKVELVGQDGNAFFILGRVQGAMKRAGLSKEQIKEYMDEATSGDYNHLLATTMKFVSCDEYDEDQDEEEDGDYDDGFDDEEEDDNWGDDEEDEEGEEYDDE